MNLQAVPSTQSDPFSAELGGLTNRLESLNLQPSTSASAQSSFSRAGKRSMNQGLWVTKKQFKSPVKSRLANLPKEPIILNLSELDPNLAALFKQAPIEKPPVFTVD